MAHLPWYTNAHAEPIPGHGLGRRPHLGTNPFRRMGAGPQMLTVAKFTVNHRLNLPYQYIPGYDQGQEGACVGFAWSWAMSILNHRCYAARKLYLETQFHDPYPETPPEEGTSVISAAQVLQTQGHWRFARGVTFPLALLEGIQDFRTATTVDELRAAIHLDVPFVLGIDWYSNFDSPVWGDFGVGGNRWWIGRGDLGRIRGGHAICGFGARDDIEAFTLVNSWGTNYPIVNIPYNTVQKLLTDGADAIIPTDR
jgi:hypothetical protein